MHMPGGYMLVKNRGVPSGSFLTQLIGTICNMLVTNYLLTATSLSHDIDKSKYLGDDGH